MRNLRVTLSLILLMCASSLRAETLTLVADYWCPFNCSPDSESPGFLIEVAQRALALSGYDIDYQTRPWSRAITEVRSGDFDGLVGAGHREVPDFVFPKRPLAVARHTFFTLPGVDWRYHGDDSLSQIKLGVIDDYSYGDLNERYIRDHRQDREHILVLNGQNVLGRFLDMLDIGRIDAFVEEEAVLSYFMTQTHATVDLRKAGIAYQEPVYIAFSPANPRASVYAAALDKGMQALKTSGELTPLAKKYGIALKKVPQSAPALP